MRDPTIQEVYPMEDWKIICEMGLDPSSYVSLASLDLLPPKKHGFLELPFLTCWSWCNSGGSGGGGGGGGFFQVCGNGSSQMTKGKKHIVRNSSVPPSRRRHHEYNTVVVSTKERHIQEVDQAGVSGHVHIKVKEEEETKQRMQKVWSPSSDNSSGRTSLKKAISNTKERNHHGIPDLEASEQSESMAWSDDDDETHDNEDDDKEHHNAPTATKEAGSFFKVDPSSIPSKPNREYLLQQLLPLGPMGRLFLSLLLLVVYVNDATKTRMMTRTPSITIFINEGTMKTNHLQSKATIFQNAFWTIQRKETDRIPSSYDNTNDIEAITNVVIDPSMTPSMTKMKTTTETMTPTIPTIRGRRYPISVEKGFKEGWISLL